jgi:hypothetical protein
MSLPKFRSRPTTNAWVSKRGATGGAFASFKNFPGRMATNSWGDAIRCGEGGQIATHSRKMGDRLPQSRDRFTAM